MSCRSTVVQEELASAVLQPQEAMDRSSSPFIASAITTDFSPAHHASCRVAVDATAKLVPSGMVPEKQSPSSMQMISGREESSSWANDVIQVGCLQTHLFHTSDSQKCYKQCSR